MAGLDDETMAELAELLTLGRRHGLDVAVRWLARAMVEAERTNRLHRRRMVKVKLARTGESAWLPAEVLAPGDAG